MSVQALMQTLSESIATTRRAPAIVQILLFESIREFPL